MRAIRRFTVRPVLPEPLRHLGDLATNLRWSWHPETQDVFATIDADIWRSSGRDPVKTLGAVSTARLDELAAGHRLPADARGGPRRPAAVPHRRPLVPEGLGGRRRCLAAQGDRLLLPGVRHHLGAPAVLRRPRHPRRRPPQDGQRPRRTPDRRRPALPVRLLPPAVLARGLAAGELPAARPRRPADHAAARARRHAGAGAHRRSRRDRARGARLRRPGRPRAAAAARHRHRGEPGPAARGDRPPLRRHHRAPAAPGAAPRHRRGPRPAHVRADHRRRAARGVPHQRGPRRLPRPRAHPRAAPSPRRARASTSTRRSR